MALEDGYIPNILDINIKEEAEMGPNGELSNADDEKLKLTSRRGRRKLTINEDGVPVYGDYDVVGDPFFLSKYRSFHNHDLDTNYIEHAHMMTYEDDIHRRGSTNYMPYTPSVIQWLSG